MGCASSKPSSKSKKSKDDNDDKENYTKKQKNGKSSSSVPKSESNKLSTSSSSNGHVVDSSLDQPIRLDKHLADELASPHNQSRVVEFLVRAVSKEFAHDLVKNSKQTGVKSDEAASRVVQESHDLTTDVASKAIALLKTTQPGSGGDVTSSNITTYRQLNDRLKASQYLCKTQTHKSRLCDLTVNKIRESVELIGDESSLSEFLAKYDQDQQLTPPQTPQQTTVSSSSSPGHENAVLLSRGQANELARILFLSNRARPVVHASPKVKDAYYVNKQLTDSSEVTVSKKEIDDILHKFDEPFTFQIKNLTYYDSPMITTSPTRDSQQPSANLLSELSSTVTTHHDNHSDTSFTQVTTTTTVVVDNAANDTTIEYENTGENNINNINSNSNNESKEENNHDVDNKKEENDEEEDADLALATVAVMSALAASSADTETKQNDELFSDEDFAKTTIVNMTTTTKTTTTTTTEQVVGTREEEGNDQEVHHDEDHHVISSSETETTTTPPHHQDEQHHEAEEDVLDPILKQSLLDDRFYNNHSFKTEPPVNGQSVNDAAIEIQAAQRAHAARQVADSMIDQIAEKAATTIQATYRGYKTRKEIRPVLTGSIRRGKLIEQHQEEETTRVVDEPTTTTTQNNNNDMENGQSEGDSSVAAATTTTTTTTTTTIITSNTILTTDHHPETTTTTTNPDNVDGEEPVKAATKIQATYRGFRTRKQLKQELKK